MEDEHRIDDGVKQLLFDNGVSSMILNTSKMEFNKRQLLEIDESLKRTPILIMIGSQTVPGPLWGCCKILVRILKEQKTLSIMRAMQRKS